MQGYEELKSLLREMEGVALGYSGGVDSALLAKAAADALGDRCVCVLIESCFVSEPEVDSAVNLAGEQGFNLLRVPVDLLEIPEVKKNPPDRCYFCKKAVFSRIIEIAGERKLPIVLDGSNADDAEDYRPGSLALKELKVRSPLKELGFTKDKIRAVSQEIGLKTWNKPSNACLASRVPYDIPLSEDILNRIEQAEKILQEAGFRQFRVRHHGNLARIEVLPADIDKLTYIVKREPIVNGFQKLGYNYVTLDLRGYRTGSMNEVLDKEDQK